MLHQMQFRPFLSGAGAAEVARGDEAGRAEHPDQLREFLDGDRPVPPRPPVQPPAWTAVISVRCQKVPAGPVKVPTWMRSSSQVGPRVTA